MSIMYFVLGLVFALGLQISGMTKPEKILNFLNLNSNSWSPALAFVLGAAVMIYALGFLFLKKRGFTFNKKSFASPPPRSVDKKLVIGSLIFGAGWGLVGLCPGPALVVFPVLNLKIIIFVLFMYIGFEIHRRVAA